MQLEFAAVIFQFRRLDDAGSSNPYRVQLAVQLGFPKAKKSVEHREFGAQIIFLPDIGLEKSRVVRPAVEDFRRGQPVTLQCQLKTAHDVLSYSCYGRKFFLPGESFRPILRQSVLRIFTFIALVKRAEIVAEQANA